MHLRDALPPHGTVAWTVRRRGQVLEAVVDANLVMDAPRVALAHVLGAGGAAPAKIDRIGFGTSGAASTGDGPALTAPHVQALPAPTYPGVGQVRWDWTLEGSAAVGLSWFEMALLCTDDVQFSRKVRGGAIVLDVDVTVEGYWLITF